MKSYKNYIIIILSALSHTLCTAGLIDNSSLLSNSSYKLYYSGIELGIINAEKYSYDAFARDEQDVFRDLYKEYMHIHSNQSINYEDWLIMNNFGILYDTQESLFQKKITKRTTADNKRRFVNVVKKGDILITGGGGVGGFIGHAAIMTTDYWVLEMPGGKGSDKGLKDNNRQMPKDKWFDLHASDWTTVYRNRDTTVAHQAAVWADHTYYNPTGGTKKTKHITYKISTDIFSLNPSYCSKLVIQAYYYGTGKKRVIHELTIAGKIIVPTAIPSYFLSPYTLINKGKY